MCGARRYPPGCVHHRTPKYPSLFSSPAGFHPLARPRWRRGQRRPAAFRGRWRGKRARPVIKRSLARACLGGAGGTVAKRGCHKGAMTNAAGRGTRRRLVEKLGKASDERQARAVDKLATVLSAAWERAWGRVFLSRNLSRNAFGIDSWIRGVRAERIASTYPSLEGIVGRHRRVS